LTASALNSSLYLLTFFVMVNSYLSSLVYQVFVYGFFSIHQLNASIEYSISFTVFTLSFHFASKLLASLHCSTKFRNEWKPLTATIIN